MMQAAQQNPKRHFHRFRWILAACLALPIAGFISIRLLPGANTDLQVKSLRDAGLPTTGDELNRWYPHVPPSSNAALIVMDATDKRVAHPPLLDDLFSAISSRHDLNRFGSALETHIESNKAALDLLHQSSALPLSRYPMNFTNASSAFAHLSGVKALAMLLAFEGASYSIHSSRRNPDLAARSVSSGFALARTLRDEPALISELVRIASVGIAVANLERVLSAQRFSDDQLRSFSRMIEDAEADGRRSGYRALVGERAVFLQYFNLPPPEFDKAFPSGGGNTTVQKLKASAYRVFDIRGRDQRLFLEMMENLTSAMTNDYPQALTLSEAANAEVDRRLANGFGRFAIVSQSVLPAMHKIAEKEAMLMTRLRCAHTAIAIERFRLTREFTGNLDHLVPTFLPRILRDPVSDQPLLFLGMNAGYQISSPAAAARLKNNIMTVFIVRQAPSDPPSKVR